MPDDSASGSVSAVPMVPSGAAAPPLIVHIVYSFDTGGLENGLVNLINGLSAERYRHAIVCLTRYTDFRKRLRKHDVAVYALNKPLGNSPRTLFRLWRLLRQLRPSIVHTRNLGALEGSVPALLAGVPICIHGEHGRDVTDLDGSNRKFQMWRRGLRIFVDRYITVSRDLETYLREKIKINPARITQIYNGVDTHKFHPASGGRAKLPVDNFAGAGQFVIGTVGRMQAVKDQLTLARAFAHLVQQVPDGPQRLRLVMIGDGPLRDGARAILSEAGCLELAWIPGERNDIAEIMRGMDLFVLPSLAEGISNTVLEAMATGLPVVATEVGGNVELVQRGKTGFLVPPADPVQMAAAIRSYVNDPEIGAHQGLAARTLVEARFSMDAMLRSYQAVYDSAVGARRAA